MTKPKRKQAKTRPSSGASGRGGLTEGTRTNRGSGGRFTRAAAPEPSGTVTPSTPQKEREPSTPPADHHGWPPFERPNGTVATERIEERFRELEARIAVLQGDLINLRLRTEEAPVSIGSKRPANGAARERCPLCAEELVHTTLHVGGMRIVAGYCARCHPDALSALLR